MAASGELISKGLSVLGSILGISLGLAGLRLLLLWVEKASAFYESCRSQQEIHQFIAIIRSQRHDYNLHLYAVSTLLRDGRYEEGVKYIDSVVADSQDVNVMMLIREPIIGALLCGYYDMAAEQGCRIEMQIAGDLSGLCSSPYDTNRILGNLLQNALEETAKETVPDKNISFITLRRGGNSVIRISNAVSDPSALTNLFEYGHSGKNAHEGIGLNSVVRILEKYHGVIHYKLKGNRIEFVVRIPNTV